MNTILEEGIGIDLDRIRSSIGSKSLAILKLGGSNNGTAHLLKNSILSLALAQYNILVICQY